MLGVSRGSFRSLGGPGVSVGIPRRRALNFNHDANDDDGGLVLFLS